MKAAGARALLCQAIACTHTYQGFEHVFHSCLYVCRRKGSFTVCALRGAMQQHKQDASLCGHPKHPRHWNRACVPATPQRQHMAAHTQQMEEIA
eukprot:1160458-Pelagomonas_calceolata.AAC.1